MKPSEFRRIYLAAIRLYGFVFSNELFTILKHYKIPFTKEEVYNDLESRLRKTTRGYVVEKLRSKQYVISHPYMRNDEFERFMEAKEGKPFYFPTSLDKFLKYAEPGYQDENDSEAYTNIHRFLKANISADDEMVDLMTQLLVNHFKYESITDLFSIFETFDIHFKKANSAEKLLNLIQKYINDLRTPLNNGFTPNEMRKMLGPMDVNKIQFSIGPNMRKNMLEGISDPLALLKEIDAMDIPLMARESLRKELLDIIQEINDASRRN